MEYVVIIYCLIFLQGLLFILHFTGYWCVVEFFFLLVKVDWIILKSFLKKILPSATHKNLKNEVALVTGGASGIGELMAKLLAKKGVKVVVWDVDIEGNRKTARDINEAGGTAFAYCCNVCNKEEVLKTAELMRKDVGDVTILVNNAGVVTGKMLLDCSEQEIRRTFEVNAISHFWTIQAFLPAMLEKNKGHIVSIASILGYSGACQLADYCASKFAAVGCMESLRLELKVMKKSGIKLTTVGPYLIQTGMFDGIKIKYPNFPGFHVLKPKEVAEEVIKAIETNKLQLFIPDGCQVGAALHNLLPVEAEDALMEFMGADEAMKSFIGRVKKST